MKWSIQNIILLLVVLILVFYFTTHYLYPVSATINENYSGAYWGQYLGPVANTNPRAIRRLPAYNPDQPEIRQDQTKFNPNARRAPAGGYKDPTGCTFKYVGNTLYTTCNGVTTTQKVDKKMWKHPNGQ